jgi:biotin transporter BioY
MRARACGCAALGTAGKLAAMNEPDPGSEGGWNAARVVGMIVAVVGMVGFGVCSLCGIAMGVSDNGRYWSAIIWFVIPGFILTFLFILLARSIARRVKRKP